MKISILKALKNFVNKTIGKDILTSENASDNSLDALQKWILSSFQCNYVYEASNTDSSYIAVDECMIRLSDHLQNNMTHKDLYIISIENDPSRLMVFMSHCKNPYILDYAEVRAFIKHYIMIAGAFKLAKKSAEISKKIKSSSAQQKKQEAPKVVKTGIPLQVETVKQRTLSDILLKLKPASKEECCDPRYVSTYWKKVEKLIIDDLPWYGTLAKNDIRRNMMGTIFARYSAGKLTYDEIIDRIGASSSIAELDVILEDANKYKRNSTQYESLYRHLGDRNANWGDFIEEIRSKFAWYPAIAPTNKKIIEHVYKTYDISTVALNKYLDASYKEYGNMKYRACLLFKAKSDEAIKLKKETA